MTTEQPASTPPAAVPPSNATPVSPEAPKPATPFEAAARVVRRVQLDAIHFGAFSAQGFETGETISGDGPASVATRFVRPTVTINEAGFSAQTTLLLQVGATLDNDVAKPYAVIRATIEAMYRWKPDAPEFTEEELRHYSLCYCPFHVWGYWREFVQSSLARLDLPPFTLPLFLIDQAPKMVQDKLD